MNTSAQLVKLFAPELIPEPLRLSGVELEQYTKKVYDYLRRLQAAMGSILEFVKIDIENSGGNAVRVYDEWIRVTTNTTKTIVDIRDWRGFMLRITLLGSPDGDVTNANNNQWPHGSTATWSGMFGVNYAGGDVDLVTFTFTGSQVVYLGIESATGQLYFKSAGFPATECQARFTVEGFTQKSAPDLTI